MAKKNSKGQSKKNRASNRANTGKQGEGKTAAKKKSTGMSTARKVGITIVCVLMAIAMCLPTLSVFMGSTAAQESASESASSASGETDASESEETATVESVDKQYRATVKAIKKKLKKEPDNINLYATLGDLYLSWGDGLKQVIMTSGQVEVDTLNKMNEHYKDAVDSLTSYIDKGGENASAAQYERGVANLDLGEYDSAIEDLKAVTDADASNASAWINLASAYEGKEDKDSARDAYNKAIEACGDDENNAQLKSYATQMLAALDKAESSSSSDSASGSESSSESGSESGSESSSDSGSESSSDSGSDSGSGSSSS